MGLSFDEGGDICWVKSGVVDGKVWYSITTQNDDSHFSDLSKEEQKIVMDWLNWNLWPAKSRFDGYTSYGMKHIMEHRTNVYITNNQMKEVMWNLGYRPTKINELNWSFKVKKSSPMFQRQIDGRLGMPMLGAPMTYPGREAAGAE